MKRPWALPLVPLYTLATAAHDAAYRLRLARPSSLNAPVISIGSLSAGGAGKTPVVIMLARLIAQHGFAVDVLTRGYGRSGNAVEEVSLSEADPAARFGDEPVEMAQAGLRVFTGRDRLIAGRLAEAQRTEGAPLIHLLDDGFQHRRLARGLNIVLVTKADVEDHLLPAGNLREPLAALRRADVILLREDEREIESAVQLWTQVPIWLIRRALQLPPDPPRKPFVFSGIARPESFLTMLAEAGVQAAGERRFPDHYRYTVADVARLLRDAQARGADGFLTTAKDAVKLTPVMQDRLSAAGPVHTVALNVRLNDQALPHLARALHLLTRPPNPLP